MQDLPEKDWLLISRNLILGENLLLCMHQLIRGRQMKREIENLEELDEELDEEFHEGYLNEELRKMNPDPFDRMGQELLALYTIPRAYVRDWWFVRYNRFRSLLNRDHWRYTQIERVEFVEMIRARVRIALGKMPKDDEKTEELF